MTSEINLSNTKRLGNDLINYAADINSDIKKLEGIIENLSSVWNGPDATKFKNIMLENNLPELKDLSELINNYGVYLTNVPEIYSALDEIYSGKNLN